MPIDQTPASDPPDGPGRVLIIGAGMAGLTAAARLSEAGRRVLIVDKGRSVGGRLATRRFDDALLDHGAQFFTARSQSFGAAIEEWTESGAVRIWCHGFAGDDGYPRYCAVGGMNRLAKHLAADLDPDRVEIITRVRVQALMSLGDAWAATYEGATREADTAAAVIVTAPVPQSLELLSAGAVELGPAIDADRLRAVSYHPVIALLTLVEGDPDLGPAGARQLPDDPDFSFIADNQAKGISPRRAVTFHVSHRLSAELFDASDAEIAAVLLPMAGARLGPASVTDHQIKKWRYAGPVEPWPNRFALVTDRPGPLLLAGDAFGGPKVEGAFLSGLAAAEQVLATS